ncbi:MAG: tyrosine-type recombinase/integrase [Burkholderiales bacterium]|nr:tyrosine-type recombinase/integrase [Burkholderiales bacterium]
MSSTFGNAGIFGPPAWPNTCTTSRSSLDFLRTRGLETLDTLQAEHLSAFVQTRTDWKPRTVACVSSNVRQFLRYLFMRGILPRDLSAAIPTVRLASNAKVPSAWEPELVEQLLSAVDRSSPKGRRDYAILLLAARLGLLAGRHQGADARPSAWSTSTIEIVQSKTGEPLVLPLIEEVGAALIDYLRAGRPPVEHRHLFTNLTPPFDPICQNDRLYRVVAYWRELAGIKFKTPQRQGLHSLRHTLATRLLAAQTPFPVISAVLGHASPATTFIYAKADVGDAAHRCHRSGRGRCAMASPRKPATFNGNSPWFLHRWRSPSRRSEPVAIRYRNVGEWALRRLDAHLCRQGLPQRRVAAIRDLIVADQAAARDRQDSACPCQSGSPLRSVYAPARPSSRCARSRGRCQGVEDVSGAGVDARGSAPFARSR